MKILSIVLVILAFVSICNAENILLSAATTDKELLLLNIEYANKKFKIVDYAIFKLPFQVGLTALGRLQNGNYQVVWTAQDASKKIKIHSMIFDANLNKVGNTKKFARVLASHFNLNLIYPDEQALKAADTEGSYMTYTKDFFTVVAEAAGVLGLRGDGDPLFDPLEGVRPIDTAIVNSLIPTPGSYYATVGFADSTAQYALLLGNTSNPKPTSAFGFTGGVVSSIDMVGTGTDNIYLYGWEKLNNPSRYLLFERLFDGLTGQPARNQRTVVTTQPGDLGDLAFFNPFGVVQSKDNPKIRYAWWSQEEEAGTNLGIKSLSDQNIKDIALYLNFDMLSSPSFVYAYDGVIMPPPIGSTICLQDESNPATKVILNTLTGEYKFDCNGTTYTGFGEVVVSGSTIRLNHNTLTSSLSLNLNRNTKTGTATYESGATICTIVDRNIDNNNCN